MLSTDERRRTRFWGSNSPSVIGMLRVEHEDRARITYSEHFTAVMVYEGAFDGWYRGRVRSHVAGKASSTGTFGVSSASRRAPMPGALPPAHRSRQHRPRASRRGRRILSA